ncbi:hypothetical protein [Bordetella pertussis]|uniref:hypothetical protein n=1 Tax=Bordetella pertussis TaxID=520 RepID=UPI0028E8AF7C|nr:hypothetical protein [Bordetella pertussis]WNQ38120.1 hypothetical protein PVZ87_20530 [Bordetella pertussis]
MSKPSALRGSSRSTAGLLSPHSTRCCGLSASSGSMAGSAGAPARLPSRRRRSAAARPRPSSKWRRPGCLPQPAQALDRLVGEKLAAQVAFGDEPEVVLQLRLPFVARLGAGRGRLPVQARAQVRDLRVRATAPRNACGFHGCGCR